MQMEFNTKMTQIDRNDVFYICIGKAAKNPPMQPQLSMDDNRAVDNPAPLE